MKKIITLLLGLATVMSCFANGGPIDGSSVYSTGDVRLLKTTGIKLLAEDLDIKIEGDYSHIRVVYTLRNDRNYRDLPITYGFPVAFGMNESEQFTWDSAYVPTFQYLLDGNSIDITQQTDLAIINTGKKHRDYDYEIRIRNHWFITNFVIPTETTVQLEVSYQVKNNFEDVGTSKTFFPNFGERQLYYDFHAASYWGNGEVQNFSIEVDASAVLGDFQIEGIPFKEKGRIYSYASQNFPLNIADPLVISYLDEGNKLVEFMSGTEMPKEKLLEVSASSTLKGDYHPEKLIDRKLETAWVEGKKGNGIGESITFKLDKYKLGAIAMINGYPKDRDTYYSNGRVKKIKVEKLVDGKWYAEEITLTEKAYDQTPGAMLQIIGDYGEGYMPVEKLRLTILEVYPGSKYDDTCISELYLLGFWND